MKGKVAAVWVSLLIIVSSIVILVEIAPRVTAPTTLYVGSGGGGNYSKIQWAIDNASDGDTVYVYNGTYYENVVVNKTISLVGENKETTIINGSAIGDVINITNFFVNVTGFTITYHGNEERDASIELYNVSDCRIVNNTISSNNWGTGIYLWMSSNNTISQNIVSPTNGRGIYLSWSSNNNISNNNISLNYAAGIKLYYSSNNYVINNTLSSNNEDGISLEYSTNNYITDNNVSPNNVEGMHIWLQSNNNTIARNTFSNNILAGVYMMSSKGNNIIYNNVTSNGGSGIQLGGSSEKNEIKENVIVDNDCGIRFDHSKYNNITYNNISNNNRGMEIFWSSNENIIKGNTVSSNTAGNGILLWGASNKNLIIKNDVLLNNIYGIRLNTSNWNWVYHNNIINNTNQAYDDSTIGNQWNDSYPSGGNYWSDYTDVDNFKGPNQDIAGSDGIWDHNYSIDSDSLDRYPLVNPYSQNTIFLFEGWNLISIPDIQPNPNLNTIFSNITGSYDSVQWYNISDSSDTWKHHYTKKSSPLNDLNYIDHTMGLWIHIIKAGGVLFDYPGTPPTSNQTIQLHPGWNMVGYPSLSSHNRTTGLNNLTFDTHVDAIQWYDAYTKTWHFMDQDDSFVPGRGYWVHSLVEIDWEVQI